MGRTSWGRIVNTPGMPAKVGSREPSGPTLGPEINRRLKSGRWRSPMTEATVFNCTPPTISRVMTWVTRNSNAAGQTTEKRLQELQSYNVTLRRGAEHRAMQLCNHVTM